MTNLFGKKVFSIDGPGQSAINPGNEGKVIAEENDEYVGARWIVMWEDGTKDYYFKTQIQPESDVAGIGIYYVESDEIETKESDEAAGTTSAQASDNSNKATEEVTEATTPELNPRFEAYMISEGIAEVSDVKAYEYIIWNNQKSVKFRKVLGISDIEPFTDEQHTAFTKFLYDEAFAKRV